ncbi:MAG: glycosyl transferase [Geminicoccaceae bacterium]|nr:glycosyl transferase [Geminicoccaceae bacterium]
MRPQPDLSIVIPAFNEEARLGATLDAYLRYCRDTGRRVEVIVVDDGSLDRTCSVVNSFAADHPEVRLIRLAENQGKGHAVRSGVVNAQGKLILFADADAATPLAEIESLEAAVRAGADMAIGSRALGDERVKVKARLYRRIIGRVFHRLVELLAVHGVKDTQCGFKLFRGTVAHELFSRMRIRGFSFDVEVLMMAQRRGYRIAEVPVNWTHQPGSKVNLVTDSARMLRDLFLIRQRHLSGEYRNPHMAPWPGPESDVTSSSDPAEPGDVALSTPRS